MGNKMQTPADFARRFTWTPIEVSLWLANRSVRLATNSQSLKDRLESYVPVSNVRAQTEFRCRVVTEITPDAELDRENPTVVGIWSPGLSLISIGQKSFLALDAVNRHIVSFVSERLVIDETLFRGYFLPALALLLQGPQEGVS